MMVNNILLKLLRYLESYLINEYLPNITKNIKMLDDDHVDRIQRILLKNHGKEINARVIKSVTFGNGNTTEVFVFDLVDGALSIKNMHVGRQHAPL